MGAATYPAALICSMACRHQLVHGAADLMIRLVDTLGVEILANLAEHVIVAGLLEIGRHDRLGIGSASAPGETQLLGRPEAQELVRGGHSP